MVATMVIQGSKPAKDDPVISNTLPVGATVVDPFEGVGVCSATKAMLSRMAALKLIMDDPAADRYSVIKNWRQAVDELSSHRAICPQCDQALKGYDDQKNVD